VILDRIVLSCLHASYLSNQNTKRANLWNLCTACLGPIFGVQGFRMDAVKIARSSLWDTDAILFKKANFGKIGWYACAATLYKSTRGKRTLHK
jgi:hypothetical protein